MLTKQVIRNFDVWDTDFDDLCLFTAQLTGTVTQYESFGVTVPEWLTDCLGESKRVTSERVRVQKLTELKRLKARRETLLSADEKRVDIEAVIEKLEREVT